MRKVFVGIPTHNGTLTEGCVNGFAKMIEIKETSDADILSVCSPPKKIKRDEVCGK